jgi:16S rRNA (cytidine1402-2'-O)-methyltransferase
VSGLPTDRFCFEGFLSAKRVARRARLTELASEPRTLVFFESSHRIVDSLADMVEVIGAEREATLARELTKQFETVRRATLGVLAEWVVADSDQQRGEFVLCVAGAPQVEPGEARLREVLAVLLDELPPRKAAALAAKLVGGSKNQAYQVALSLREE